MTKYFCDGCGTQLADAKSGVDVAISKKHRAIGMEPDVLASYDLCADCFAHLISAANPSKWPRTKS